MIASIAIALFSILLLLYWLRYTCLLLLRNGADRTLVTNPVFQRGFTFGSIAERLRNETELDPLHRALQRDYHVLTYLVQHASGLELANFDERLLVWDYRLLQVWYAVTKTAAPERARQALGESADVLRLLASRIGQRAGLQPQA
jgi:hypothetical protein